MQNKKNITIEATQTYSPGNVELLTYLLKKLDSCNLPIIIYLGHPETIKQVQNLNLLRVTLLKSSVLMTFIRSLKNRRDVLFFCSYPPLRYHTNSIVYFHSSFFSNRAKIKSAKIPFKTKLTRIVVHFIIKFFHRKVDAFYCQTENIKSELTNNFSGISVKVRPFYNDFDLLRVQQQKKDVKFDFIYPATADNHKNYFNLFEAILILGAYKKTSLIVTIPKNKSNFIERIHEVNMQLGYEAIINIGRVPKNTILEIYNKSKALVFPSLEESLGLPLIEACELHLPIIGSDLPFMYNVVENPITFDPYDPENIADTMNAFLDGQFQSVNQSNLVVNQVQEIINVFK